MSLSVASATRRRRFCIPCGRIRRPCGECNDASEPSDREELCRVAGMPNTEPYPLTAVNLRRTARELDDAAIVKQAKGDERGAEACRQLADLNRQEAAEIKNKP